MDTNVEYYPADTQNKPNSPKICCKHSFIWGYQPTLYESRHNFETPFDASANFPAWKSAFPHQKENTLSPNFIDRVKVCRNKTERLGEKETY